MALLEAPAKTVSQLQNSSQTMFKRSMSSSAVWLCSTGNNVPEDKLYEAQYCDLLSQPSLVLHKGRLCV